MHGSSLPEAEIRVKNIFFSRPTRILFINASHRSANEETFFFTLDQYLSPSGELFSVAKEVPKREAVFRGDVTRRPNLGESLDVLRAPKMARKRRATLANRAMRLEPLHSNEPRMA